MNKLILFVIISLTLQKSWVLGGNYKKPKKLNVLVIGAGPAGLSVTRFLSNDPDKFKITVFEKSFDIGGQWLYTNKTNVDDYGNPVHSSVYENLRINGPKETTNYIDWPEFRGPNKSFVSHYFVWEYLKNYTQNFQLKPYIQFNTVVENVSLKKINGSEKWQVAVKNLKSSITRNIIFDAVIVCNGHFSEPSIPHIPGLKNFKGIVLHSHSYRKADDFRNKSIILLGGGISGIDIGQELLKVSQLVYLSHNHNKLPISRFIQIPGVIKFENGKFILKDNSSMVADVLIFCTGYKFSYPFLDNSTQITVDDNFVYPLYKHIINAQHPSMSFIGIPQAVFSSFLLFPIQAQYIISVLKSRIQLPSKTIMVEESKLKTARKKDAHKLLDSWGYADELAQLGGFSSIPDYYRISNRITNAYHDAHMDNYRNYNLVISPDKKSVELVKVDE